MKDDAERSVRPVTRVSPTRIFNPGSAGSDVSPRVTVASPDAVRTMPIVSPAGALAATARRHRVTSRTAALTVFLIVAPSGFRVRNPFHLYPSPPGECQ